MMGELVFGAEEGTQVGGFWAADGTGYGDGLEEKLKRKEEKERRGGYLQRGWGTFREQRTSAGEIQTRERKVTQWNIQVRSSVNLIL